MSSVSSKPLVLVTGVSGFLGANIAYQLLTAGYPVRGTVRKAKIDEVRDTAGAKYPQLQLVEVDDIAKDDVTDALKGVGAVIHVASPMDPSASADAMFDGAIEGTLNVVRQAQRHGITKIVITSSYGTIIHPSSIIADTYAGKTWTEKDWGNITREEASQNTMTTYLASKIFAEQEAWKFAEAHPELDVATILPPFIYGPFAPNFPTRAFGSNNYVGALITGAAGRPLPAQMPPYFCDVRDVARAHIAALELPKLPQGADVQEKRFLISGGSFTWAEAVKHLKSVRPELAGRLPKVDDVDITADQGKLSTIDTSRAAKVLGITEYVPWQKTVEDTINNLLAQE